MTTFKTAQEIQKGDRFVDPKYDGVVATGPARPDSMLPGFVQIPVEIPSQGSRRRSFRPDHELEVVATNQPHRPDFDELLDGLADRIRAEIEG